MPSASTQLVFDITKLPKAVARTVALLETFCVPPHREKSVYAAVASNYDVEEASLPALRAHITMALNRVCVTERVPREVVPFLGEALFRYLKSESDAQRDIVRTGFVSDVQKLFATFTNERVQRLFENSLSRICRSESNVSSSGDAVPTLPARPAGTRNTEELKRKIYVEIVNCYETTPLVPSDPRLREIASRNGVTPHTVFAYRAHITMGFERLFELCCIKRSHHECIAPVLKRMAQLFKALAENRLVDRDVLAKNLQRDVGFESNEEAGAILQLASEAINPGSWPFDPEDEVSEADRRSVFFG